MPSARTSRNRVAPPVTTKRAGRRNPLDRQSHGAIEQRSGGLGAGAVGEREHERRASAGGKRRGQRLDRRCEIAGVRPDGCHRIGRMRRELLDLGERHRVMAADHQQQRRAQADLRRRRGRSGERPRQARRADPQEWSIESSPGANDGPEVIIAAGVA